jgi:branched-chain amino acid transport system ATP-binding protein
MTAATLRVESIEKRFGNVVAVHDVSLELEPGGCYGLIGPNGAGKSTLFDLISGVQRPGRGAIFLDGEDVTAHPPEDLAQRGVLRTYQHTSVFPALSVRENLMTGGFMIDRRSPFASIFMTKAYRRAHRELRARADEILDLVGIAARADERASSLSYGELRLLEVAIALMSRPRLLLLDEPAAGLNEAEARRLQELLHLLAADVSVTTVVVEHNVALVMNVCAEVWVLHHGELIAQGRPSEVVENPRVREVYLGV